MRISFGDNSYIEARRSSNGKIAMILSAKNFKDSKNTIVNSVELTVEEFTKLIADLDLDNYTKEIVE